MVITLEQPDALLEYALASTAAHVVNKAFVEANGDKYGTPERGLDRHRPVQVRRMGERRPPDARPLRRLLGQGQRRSLPRRRSRSRSCPSPRPASPGLRDRRDRLHHQQRPVRPVRDRRRRSTTSTSPSPPSYYGEWITFNTQQPPFDNVKVRQALNYAFDKKAVRELYYGADTPDDEGDARLPDPRGPSSEPPPGRPPGTRCRATTRTSSKAAPAARRVGRRGPAQRQDDRLLRVDAVDQGHRRGVHRRHGQAGHHDQGPAR